MCQEGSSDLTSAIEGAIKDERIHLGKKDQRKYKGESVFKQWKYKYGL